MKFTNVTIRNSTDATLVIYRPGGQVWVVVPPKGQATSDTDAEEEA